MSHEPGVSVMGAGTTGWITIAARVEASTCADLP